MIEKIRSYWNRLQKKSEEERVYQYLKKHGVETELGYVQLDGLPIIKKCPGSRIIIHKGVTLTSTSEVNVAGVSHPVILATLTPNAIIEIGEKSGASGAAICAVEIVLIGKNCAIGAGAKIYDTDFHPLDPMKRSQQKDILEAKSGAVTIKDNSWIGAGSIVLKNVTIGEGSAVGPLSVVIKSIPDFEFHAGNPAKLITRTKE
jgi:acetyltransferase-like isoleucine patch superfamily enzyme